MFVTKGCRQSIYRLLISFLIYIELFPEIDRNELFGVHVKNARTRRVRFFTKKKKKKEIFQRSVFVGYSGPSVDA